MNQSTTKRRSLPLWLVFFVFSSLSLSLLFNSHTQALSIADFKAGNIISDVVFTDKNSMTESKIQAFLDEKVDNCDSNGSQNSEMDNSGVPDYNGNGSIQRWEWAKKKYGQTTFTCLKDYSQGGKSAAKIINETAKEFSINPQVLIVLLQKEQGLVNDTWPLNIQYRSATGYGCPDTAACDADYYGFTNQVRWAATMFRAIMNDSPTWYTPYNLGNNSIPWNPNTSACGYSTVNIQNRATQALYNYTPYRPNSAALNAGFGTGNSCSSYGNRNFFLYFISWFGSTQKKNNIRLITCGGEPYLVERYRAVKRHISAEAITAWNFPDEYFTDNDPGCTYPSYAVDLGIIIRSRNSGKVYLVDNDKTFWVTSQALASDWNLGNISGDLPQLDSESILDNLDTGETLSRIVTSNSLTTTKIYVINDGKRYTLTGSDIGDNSSARLFHGYNDGAVKTLSVSLLSGYAENATRINYAFKVDSNWYLLDFGKVRKINNEAVWTSFISGPTLTDGILGMFSTPTNIGNGFQRNGIYHLFDGTTDVDVTPDLFVAQKWGIGKIATITQLLTNKLLPQITSSEFTYWQHGNVRLIECSGQKYMVERYRRAKRPIDDAVLAEWNFTNKYFTNNDPGCTYPTYASQLQQLIRSRTTGKVYYVEKGEAHWVTGQTTADNWSFGTLSSDPYPQFDGTSIHDTLDVTTALAGSPPTP